MSSGLWPKRKQQVWGKLHYDCDRGAQSLRRQASLNRLWLESSDSEDSDILHEGRLSPVDPRIGSEPGAAWISYELLLNGLFRSFS